MLASGLPRSGELPHLRCCSAACLVEVGSGSAGGQAESAALAHACGLRRYPSQVCVILRAWVIATHPPNGMTCSPS